MQALTREQFLKTEAGVLAKLELQRMVNSSDYNTFVAYDASVGRKIAFVDRHLNYLAGHPYIIPAGYLANLRVMTKAKR